MTKARENTPEEKASLRQCTSLGKLFTEKQIQAACDLYRTDPRHFHARVRNEIIKPCMAHINRVTNQENDPDYMAYAVEFALMSCLRTEGVAK